MSFRDLYARLDSLADQSRRDYQDVMKAMAQMRDGVAQMRDGMARMQEGIDSLHRGLTDLYGHQADALGVVREGLEDLDTRLVRLEQQQPPAA